MNSTSMKNSHTLARLSSFFALLCIILNFHIFLVLHNYFLPQDIKAVAWVFLFNPLGSILGLVLCPFFLPSPGNRKPLPVSFAFILLVTIPNVTMRSMGVGLWINSMLGRSLILGLSGLLYPICSGLFFLTHLYSPGGRGNKAGRHYVFFFSLVMVIGLIVLYFSSSILGSLRLFSDPSRAMDLLFGVLTGLIAGIGIFSLTCLAFYEKGAKAVSGIQAKPVSSPPTASNWPLALSLIGISAASKILNGVSGIWLFPFINNSEITYNSIIFVALAVIILGFLAGRSMRISLRLSLSFAMALYILLPCLLLFESNLAFLEFMNSLVSFFTNWTLIIFTAALVELCTRRFSFYPLSSVIYATNVLVFLSPLIARYLPPLIEYKVLTMGIAAIIIVFFAFMAIISKPQARLQSAEESRPVPITNSIVATGTSLEDILRQNGLSGREIEVTSLFVKEGLGTKEIAGRLYISPLTVKDHIANACRKFSVKNRSALLVAIMKERERIEIASHGDTETLTAIFTTEFTE